MKFKGRQTWWNSFSLKVVNYYPASFLLSNDTLSYIVVIVIITRKALVRFPDLLISRYKE